jgi:hypothetical protein
VEHPAFIERVRDFRRQFRAAMMAVAVARKAEDYRQRYGEDVARFAATRKVRRQGPFDRTLAAELAPGRRPPEFQQRSSVV